MNLEKRHGIESRINRTKARSNLSLVITFSNSLRAFVRIAVGCDKFSCGYDNQKSGKTLDFRRTSNYNQIQNKRSVEIKKGSNE